MATNFERYEVLRKHLPEEAARVIAEAFPSSDQLVTRDYLDARAALDGSIRSDIHRWMLTFMATQWLGVAGILVAIFLRG